MREALDLLGVESSSTWEQIRTAYREQLMAHHPDAAGTGATADQTERVVEAFRTLRALTDDGLKPLPGGASTDWGLDPTDLDDPNAPLILHALPGDVFVRLCQAADEIGHLSYADRDANTLQVTLDSTDQWGPSSLTAELSAEGSLTLALFSLEPLGVRPAPPIADVVAELAQTLRRPAPIDS